nr:beta-1,6-N-acetylglucosaminyltransferase [uncultured Bacteroides sp.]
MKHAILIIAHRDFDHLCSLINFFDDNFLIYIHVDIKSNFTKKEIVSLSEMKNVISVYKRFKVNWSGFNILRCELFLIKKALENNDIDYIHLLSGQDFPIKSTSEFLSYFDDNKGHEFIGWHLMPTENWEKCSFVRYQYFRPYDLFDYKTKRGKIIINKIVNFQMKYNLRRRIPDQFIRLYGGSNWFSLSKQCAKYVSNYTQRYPAFYRRLKYTFAPEETYFQTIILNSSFKNEVINNDLRYISWKRKNDSFPACLDEKDFFNIVVSERFFARKFDLCHSGPLLSLIKKYLLSDNDFNIASKGYWISNSFKGHRFDNQLTEALGYLLHYMGVKTIVDFGCGPGWYVKALRRKGFKIVGYDANPYVTDLSKVILQDGTVCQHADLTDNLISDTFLDLVLCLEVGEHIPKEYEDQFIKNLVQNAREYIILSWAIEGQKGDGHINCHSNQYVIAKLSQAGFSENVPAKNYLRHQAKLDWFRNTIMVFQRNHSLISCSASDKLCKLE